MVEVIVLGRVRDDDIRRDLPHGLDRGLNVFGVIAHQQVAAVEAVVVPSDFRGGLGGFPAANPGDLGSAVFHAAAIAWRHRCDVDFVSKLLKANQRPGAEKLGIVGMRQHR